MNEPSHTMKSIAAIAFSIIASVLCMWMSAQDAWDAAVADGGVNAQALEHATSAWSIASSVFGLVAMTLVGRVAYRWIRKPR